MSSDAGKRPVQQTYVGFGHSHIVALAKGAYALQAKDAKAGGALWRGRFVYLYDSNYEPALTATGQGPLLNPRIASELTHGDPRFVLASIGGNEHNILAIPQAARRYDFILGENPEMPLDPGAEILTESVVRETLRSWMREKTDVLLAIRAATDLPIYLAEPPPPLPKENVLAYPQEFFRSMMGRRVVSSDALRYKMWRVQSSIYREFGHKHGIVFIQVPPDAIDGGGMLAQSFCGQDATHANDVFGEAILKDILSRQTVSTAN